MSPSWPSWSPSSRRGHPAPVVVVAAAGIVAAAVASSPPHCRRRAVIVPAPLSSRRRHRCCRRRRRYHRRRCRRRAVVFAVGRRPPLSPDRRPIVARLAFKPPAWAPLPSPPPRRGRIAAIAAPCAACPPSAHAWPPFRHWPGPRPGGPRGRFAFAGGRHAPAALSRRRSLHAAMVGGKTARAWRNRHPRVRRPKVGDRDEATLHATPAPSADTVTVNSVPFTHRRQKNGVCTEKCGRPAFIPRQVDLPRPAGSSRRFHAAVRLVG